MQHKASWLKNCIRRYSLAPLVLGFVMCIQSAALYGMEQNTSDHPNLLFGSLAQQEAQNEQRMAPNFYDFALMEYITTKNVAGVQETLKQPVHINFSCAEYHGHTPLSEAIATDNSDIVELLLSHSQIDVDADADRGYRAVHIAALQGQPQMVRIVCARGASLVLLNIEGSTPLHEAVQHKENDFACVYNLISVVPAKRVAQLVNLELLALHLFRCCVKDRQAAPPCGLGKLPKDVRYLLCSYYLCASVDKELRSIVQAMLQKKKIDLDLLVELQLAYLQPILEARNKRDQTPYQLVLQDQPKYVHLRNLLAPEDRSCRRLAIENYLKEPSVRINLWSTHRNSEQLQTQPTEDTASITK